MSWSSTTGSTATPATGYRWARPVASKTAEAAGINREEKPPEVKVASDGTIWIEHVISTTIDRPESVFAIDVDGDDDVDQDDFGIMQGCMGRTNAPGDPQCVQ